MRRLCPGAMIEMQGPGTKAPAGFVTLAAGREETPVEILVHDARSKERHFIPHGTRCLVIGVEGSWEISTVYLFHMDFGFLKTESARVRVLWSPVDATPDPPQQ